MENPLSGICILTVTYGDRGHFLSQLLDYAERTDDVAQVIVVDNGSDPPVEAVVKDGRFSKATIVRRSRNGGSAIGFRTALEAAMQSSHSLFWMLDDDNLPRPGAAECMLEAHSTMISSNRPFALLSFRADHQREIAANIPVERAYPRPSSFLGFDARELPRKLVRKMSTAPAKPLIAVEHLIVPFASYSGLFFDRDLLTSIGLPNPDFVLYSDDTEYSYRITKYGGRIFLLRSAELDDLEKSWNIESHKSAAASWVLGKSNLRMFYAMRNRVYFDKYIRNDRVYIYYINRLLYMIFLFFFAACNGKLSRFNLIRQAVRDGESGRLGEEPAFPVGDRN